MVPLSLSLVLMAAIVTAGVLASLVWARLGPATGSQTSWLGVSGALALLAFAALGARGSSSVLPWVPELGLSFSFSLDGFGVVFLAIVGVVGLAVFAFSASYLRGKAGSARFNATMLAFAGSMAGLVLSADVFTLFVFWEATTFTSYLLIGHHHQTGSARRAARQAALVTGAGGLAMLAGLVILSIEAGTSSIAGIVAARPDSTAAWLLVLVGAMTKSAQFPFQGWLPAAMAAPTPASAFLHSATMVKAGIVLVGRLGPGAGDVGWWAPAVIAVGLVTMLVGGARALRQHDLKLILAYGTVSALGLLFALIGSALPSLVVGGIALLVAHAVYKSALFLTVGAIDAQEKTRDIRRLSGLRRRSPWLFVAGVAAAASMAGVPLTLGFASKEAALESLLTESVALTALVALFSALTAAYSVRFVVGGFGGAGGGSRVRSSPGLLMPPLLLAMAGLALGLFPGLLAGPEAAAASALVGVVDDPKLVVWPGLVPAFGMSMVSLVVGGLVGWWTVRRTSEAEVSRSHLFDQGVDRVQNWAERLTSVIQNGSLPVYLGQILMVAIVVPIPALVRIGVLPSPPAGGAVQWLVVVFLVAASIALLFVKRRMAAVLLLGAVGYAMSALFALAGAPDVALTQVLVETLVVALFALALRLLPPDFSTRLPFAPWKVGVAVLSGVFAAVVTLAAASVGDVPVVSEEQIALAVPEADGANVVNVILVDFRALDTFGEIAVLAVATLGVMALVKPFGDILSSRIFELRNSPILERGARIINPLLLVFAAYLLFAGHNQPGGGFAAGLVASGAVVIVWLARGAPGVRRALRAHPAVIIGAGLLVAGLTGLGGFVWADSFLASSLATLDLGPLGESKAVTPLLFDSGVALTVLGSVAAAIKGLEAA
jgi:multicomponent Na+:H+ antiporter subunit A